MFNKSKLNLGDNFLSRIDYEQLFIVFLLAIISITAISSAQNNTVYTRNFIVFQSAYYCIGFLIALFVMRFDYEQLIKVAWYLYWAINVVLLTMLFLPESIAPTKNGIKGRWISMPGMGTIQPSELLKVILIIVIATLIHVHHTNYPKATAKSDRLLLFKIISTTALSLSLIISIDLGTSISIAVIAIGMTIVSGIRWSLLLPLFGVGTIFILSFLFLAMEKPEFLEKYAHIKSFRLKRIYAWKDPYNTPSSDSYQLILSFQAIGSGELFGKGYGNREVALPEAHTDLIFGIIGEEYGFIGSSILILLFFLLIFSWIRIGIATPIPFNSYVCAGAVCYLGFHVFQNIGMDIGLMPITGLPLPFISSGGSALWANLAVVGLTMGVRFHHKTLLFSDD